MDHPTAIEKSTMKVNIGISEEHREAIAESLSRLLADTYMLYLKTHNYHWNVTGPHFLQLHDQFEEQYSELASAVDEIAERIRALGFRAPGSFREFAELTSISEEERHPSAQEMIERSASDNERVLQTAREALEPCEAASDESSIDLLTERLKVHSKTAWMLRSMLQE